MATKTDVRRYHTHAANHLKKLYKVTLSNSYVSGGEMIDLSDDFSVIDSARVVGLSGSEVAVQSARLFKAKATPTTAGVIAFDNALAEVAGAVDLSAVSVGLLVEGIIKDGIVSDGI